MSELVGCIAQTCATRSSTRHQQGDIFWTNRWIIVYASSNDSWLAYHHGASYLFPASSSPYRTAGDKMPPLSFEEHLMMIERDKFHPRF
jgi:hypothetical protein